MAKLIICPNATKLDLLKTSNSLNNTKYMDINEFMNNYYFNYSYNTISYIMDKYNVSYNTSKIYLNNLYDIDINKNYINNKLNKLKELKLDLINNNLILYNDYFKNYLKDTDIEVINYPKLEKYIYEDLKSLNAKFINKGLIDKKYSVLEFDTMYNEIVYISEKILELLKQGVSLNNIYIINYSSEYLYTIKNVFKMFNIPVELPDKNNLLSNDIVKKYLVTKKLPEEDNDNSKIIKAIINIENALASIQNNHKEIFKELIKDVSIYNNKYSDAVHITNIYDKTFTNSDYVFMIGFNYKSIPITYKDEDFILDIDKDEVRYFLTEEKNIKEKEILLNYMSNINNLTITYKLSDYKDSYYKSSLVDECNMEIINENKINLNYSEKYNKRIMSILLDNYYNYNILDKNTSILLNNYENIYSTYDNKFTGISSSKYLNSIERILLSYTSLNSYNLCGFKYYINYVLKVDPFEENFITLIGNLFHHVLEHSYDDNFDFNNTFDNYLKEKNLSIKEMYLIKKLKEILLKEIDIIKENDKYTDFHDRMFEKNILIPLNNSKKESFFNGKIDKIIYYKEINNTYFSIIDYKTGSFDANLNNMKYGIGMQLAIYLYLIIKGEIFDSPIFGGMYFQKVLMGNVSYDGRKTYLDKLKDNLKLVGYSTDNVDILEHLDHTYTNSNLIRGMKVSNNGFYSYTKVLTDDEVLNIFKYTEKIINEALINITNANFNINPKRIGNDLVSCKYCKYKDLCYRTEEDIINLEENDNLDFLGE